MPFIIADCPECNVKCITFDVNSDQYVGKKTNGQDWHELFSVCRNCKRATTFLVAQRFDMEMDDFVKCESIMEEKEPIDKFFTIEGVSVYRDSVPYPPPNFIPEDIKIAFKEGVECISVKCWNAAGTMFRSCLDLTAKDKLAKAHHRKSLFTKLNYLFDEKILSEDLRELANCIRKDGNDGAHDVKLTKVDAMDLLDFAVLFLESAYTNPKKIENAVKRRAERKAKEVEEAKKVEEQLEPLPAKPASAKPKRRLVKPTSLHTRPNMPTVTRIKSKIPLTKRTLIRNKAKGVPTPE